MTPSWNANYHVKTTIDDAKKYRYLFECNWSPGGHFVTFILLHPETCEVTQTDPTLRRCIHYAKLWGFDGLKVVHLYALVTTDVESLGTTRDSIGPENNQFILYATDHSSAVILAWGDTLTTPLAQSRMRDVYQLVHHQSPHCLKVTSTGNYPRHPLYLSKSLIPVPYQL